MNKLMRDVMDLPVGATIACHPGHYERVTARPRLDERGCCAVIRTNKGEILAGLPCQVEIVD